VTVPNSMRGPMSETGLMPIEEVSSYDCDSKVLTWKCTSFYSRDSRGISWRIPHPSPLAVVVSPNAAWISDECQADSLIQLYSYSGYKYVGPLYILYRYFIPLENDTE